jgi:CxxC motif-containing protein (DUF1111 family)
MKTTRLLLSGGPFVLALILLLQAGNFASKSRGENNPDLKISGRELFVREWMPGDRRSHSGDGLGPVFNARSCVACHHQGGDGGAGPRHMNVRVVSAFLEGIGHQIVPTWSAFTMTALKPPQPDRSKLAEIHPALRTENSFPFHRFATNKGFAKWKIGLADTSEGTVPFDPKHFDAEVEGLENSVQTGNSIVTSQGSFSRKVGDSSIQLILSERSTPSLFGVGLIDRIPDRVLEEVAMSQARANMKAHSTNERSHIREQCLSPKSSRLPVSGRVARLRDGRVGRFGWKAQTASLRDFTFQACASELGLEVPGFPQATPPWEPGYKAPGLDMTREQCDTLVQFVASMPPPGRRSPETEQHQTEIAEGQKLFTRIGCAVCHQPRLGDVDGIYSDLLLHDMGPKLADSGEYGGSNFLAGDGPSDRVDPLPIVSRSEPESSGKKMPKFGAAPREWRTPPLWGLRDSAPYLHDGRADTISAAVAFHGGEGDDSATQFLHLSLRERQQVELFLQSLGVER